MPSSSFKVVQILTIFIIVQNGNTEAPPGYVKPPETADQNPPKYEYGYNIEDDKGTGHGKLEARDGIYALGRYYVNNKDSSHNVQYYADDWGYHPFIEYSNVGPHSKSRTQLLLGVEAVKALASNKFTSQAVPPNQHITDSINKINQNDNPHQQVHNPIPIIPAFPQSTNVVPIQQQQQQEAKPVFVQQNYVVPQYETAPLYEDSKQRTISTQQIIQHNNNEYDEATLANLGNYGTKVTPSQLIQSTRNLVSGQDVLNINQAVQEQGATIESSTAKAIVTEYSTNVQHGGSLVENIQVTPPVTESTLSKEPIVVADLQEKNIESSTIIAETQGYSTTANTISTQEYAVTEPSTILVTPRPVSTNFLAPITAGIQLQNIESEKSAAQFVQIQKSVPYYLGKFEYVQSPGTYLSQVKSQHEEKAVENFELGKTLLAFPEQPKVLIQQLPELSIRENFVHQEQQHNEQQVVEKIIEKPVPYPVIETKIVEKPVEVTKIVNQPYPVQVPVHIPVQVPVEKHIPVEKIIEKPIHVPQPYPVEKIVEKQVPVEVTRYIDRPYPVQVPVQVPYPVDRIVEKIVKQPYPVEVRVPVEVQVEKIIEKKIPVPHYIEKQVPVERIVEKPIHHYIDRPYAVQVPIPQPYIVQVPQQHYHQQTKTIQNYEQQHQEQQQSYVYAPTHLNQYLPPKVQINNGYLPPKVASTNNGYLPPKVASTNNGYLPPIPDCDQHNSQSSKNLYYTIKTDDYIGLLPPKAQGTNLKTYPRKFRNARSNFNTNLRLEYGFMPPLIPSLEIDENGKPVEKN